ncbi:ABC transporter permease [Vacuolonema iberomarrocanum]|uniref:ABC transporter permease n=1 Tax=Vacuolonema iberomarrocanum TaxID=3454632 RepID=UPI0019F48AA3|nr:ABC transporter permease [filamentous cyanobacterium LEGE 07170]
MALSLLDLLAATLRDIQGNWVRSGLTALGIFMGVAAVNATLNIDAISTAQLQAKLAERDRPFVVPIAYDPQWIRPQVEFTEADLQTIQREIEGIANYSLVTEVFGLSDVRFSDNSATSVDVVGVSQTFQETTGRRLIDGRFFNTIDFEQFYPVVIIDEVLAQQLFQGESAIGQGIYLGTTRFTVIGISETKQMWVGSEPQGELWMTRAYAKLLAGIFSMDRPQLSLTTLDNYQAVESTLQQWMQTQYPGYTVHVWSNADDLYREEQQQRISSRVFKSMGVLALVIGGVGIANITVAAVVERTREIGLRRALGATDFEVMAQFVVEAVVLSLIGGLVAVTTVHFATKTAAVQIFEAPYEFRIQDALLSMGAAFAVGVGSSFLPAMRVTRLDVVEALRGE